jgi:hypothetical protein
MYYRLKKNLPIPNKAGMFLQKGVIVSLIGRFSKDGEASMAIIVDDANYEIQFDPKVCTPEFSKQYFSKAKLISAIDTKNIVREMAKMG